MTDGHNADVLQRLSDEQRAVAQPDLLVAPTVVEPPHGTETSDAALTNTTSVSPAVVPPVEPVAKAPAGRRGSAAAN